MVLTMTKPSEEGKIWEWRAFGRIDDELARKVRAYPIRFGIEDLRGEDVYLVSPLSNQNVKLRKYSGGGLLKFKLLLETRPEGFELYKETAEFTYPLPISFDTLKEAARLLAIKLPDNVLTVEKFSEEEFVQTLARSSPPALETRVSKRRSQYQFENGWVELADVEFKTTRVQSLSIHSPEIETVKRMLSQVEPGNELEPMNYIEACRRWG